MPRAHRQHTPRSGVHITARIQNGAKLFIPELRDPVANALTRAAKFSGASTLGLVVMPNHFHLVIQQGSLPLGWMMQCAMQRIALLIRRHFAGEGHVFGRRYWSCACASPNYLRQAILYTHLNPWKAKLCAHPEEYEWSTEAALQGSVHKDWERDLSLEKTRSLFAVDDYSTQATLRSYSAFLGYAKLRYENAVPGDKYLFDWSHDLYRPRAPMGDEHWGTEYAHAPATKQRFVEQSGVRDRAVALLRSLAPDFTLDDLRGRRRERRICQIRRELVAALLTSGYRGSTIARCLYVSPSMVSDVANEIRRGRTPLIVDSAASAI